MAKDAYETYGFLENNDSQNENDQFFVVQNDGTLLINRQVQYVTEVKGVLENVEPIQVYDVESQQYFVNVNNTSEVVTVPDQYVIPENAAGNVYENNFILQAIPETTAEHQSTESVVANELENVTEKQDNESVKYVIQLAENTEITLTDEQYHMLEQKGWVLFESNEQMLLLNALGLHDITGNDKLIEELKNGCQITQQQVIEEQQKPGISEYSLAEFITEKGGDNQTIQLIIPNDADIQDALLLNDTSDKAKQTLDKQKPQILEEPKDCETPATSADIPPLPELTKKPSEFVAKHNTILRMKTNLSYKDIPNKLVLGKTANGKNLVARVVKVVKPDKIPCSESKDTGDPENGPPKAKVANKGTKKNNFVNDSYYKAAEVESLIQQNLNGTRELICSAEDVSTAENIIKQLLNVPSTKAPMIGRNLLISKIVKTIDENQVETESEPTLVTGRVAQFDDEGEWYFIYIPDLLQKLMRTSSNDEEFEMSVGGVPVRRNHIRAREDYVLHIHIVEVKPPDAPIKRSITFSKRQPPISLYLLNKKKDTTHACGACARIFQTEEELKDHRESHCLDNDDYKPPLVIDTEMFTRRYISKKYSQGPKRRKTDSRHGVYKCRMCPRSYYYPSSLSKHIMDQHIKTNVALIESG